MSYVLTSECGAAEQEAAQARGLHPDHLQLRPAPRPRARSHGGQVLSEIIAGVNTDYRDGSEEQRDAEHLWSLVKCQDITQNIGTATSASVKYSPLLIPFLVIGASITIGEM